MAINLPSPPSSDDRVAWQNWASQTRAELERFGREISKNEDVLSLVSEKFVGVNANLNIIRAGAAAAGIWVGNPAAGDTIVQSLFVDNMNGRTAIWGLNIDCVQQPIAAGGGVGIAHALEIDVVQSQTANTPDIAFSGGAVAHGIELIASVNTSSSPQKPQAGLWLWSADDSATTTWWNFGIALSRVANVGIAFEDYPGDSIHGFAEAAIRDTSNSGRVLYVGGSHSNIFDLSAMSDTAGTFLRAPAGFDSNFFISNFADHGLSVTIDSGNGTPQEASIAFSDHVSQKWKALKTNGNDFAIFNMGTSKSSIFINHATDDVVFAAGITTNKSTALVSTGTALANGAGISGGTLTNAPSSGNPTKWVPINDNGTTRWVPTW